MNLSELISQTLPTDEELEELSKKHYNDLLNNENNYSYWSTQVKDCGISMVNSFIFKLNYEMYKLIGELYELRYKLPDDEFYQTDEYKIWQSYVKNLVKNVPNKIYSIKSGTFSNKFDFKNSISDKADVPSKILHVLFRDFEVGAEGISEFVLRDFIKSPSDKLTIYNGMPLNTEYRVFYDFDTHQIKYIVNYWDYDYCSKHLNSTDSLVFNHVALDIESEFVSNKDLVFRIVSEAMKNVRLEGEWSIDIMYSEQDDTYYLIDMAIASQSAYYRG